MFKPIEIDLTPGKLVKFGRKIDSKRESTRLSRDQQIAHNASALVENSNDQDCSNITLSNQIIGFRSKVVSRSHAELWLGKDRQVFYDFL